MIAAASLALALGIWSSTSKLLHWGGQRRPNDCVRFCLRCGERRDLLCALPAAAIRL